MESITPCGNCGAEPTNCRCTHAHGLVFVRESYCINLISLITQTSRALIGVQTSANEYVLVHNVKLILYTILNSGSSLKQLALQCRHPMNNSKLALFYILKIGKEEIIFLNKIK